MADVKTERDGTVAIPNAAECEIMGMIGYGQGLEPGENPFRVAYEAWDAGWMKADREYRAISERNTF